MSALPSANLAADLETLLGTDAVVSGAALALRAVPSWAGTMRAQVLVRPNSVAQLSSLLRYCYSRSQPVVAQGGLSGLVHGAETLSHHLAVSMERFNQIESIDPLGRTMRVQAGVTMAAAQQAAEERGLKFPVDLGGRDSATIGGNIATNAGGVQVLRFGMMRQSVLGLEAVLADGTVVTSLNRMLKNNAGYDLKQLFIGTEGTLGIVTRAELRLVPQPRSCDTALLALADFAALTRTLAMLDAELAGNLTSFEAMWGDYYELNTTAPSLHKPPLPHGASLYALVETQGAAPLRDREMLEGALARAIEAGDVQDCVLAKSENERRAMWQIREDFALGGRHGPLLTFDVSLPIVAMPDYIATVRAALAAHFTAPLLCVFGHVADGNLHLCIGAGSKDDAVRERVERCVYEPLQTLGGSVSAEHGIGLEKRAYLEISRSPNEIALMRTLKSALDPRGILNPGKVLPPAAAH